MQKFIRSAVLIAILIGVAVLGVTTALKARTPPKIEKRAEPTLLVRTVSPVRQTRRPALFLIGKVEAEDQATLTAPIEADVLDIAVREGDYFPKNKSLVQIDTRDLRYTTIAQQAQIDELQAQLNSIQRNRNADRQRRDEMARLLELAEKDYARNQHLFEEKVLPLKQLEQSEQALRARQSEFTVIANQVADYDTQQQRVEAQMAATEAQQAQTRLLIERARLRAPFAGRVIKVHTAVGARTPRGAALIEIFDPAQLRLRVAVAQRYAAAVKQGEVQTIIEHNGAAVTLAYTGIEPRVETGDSSINTFFGLPSGDWLLGAVYDVVVELPPIEEVIALPIEAIYNDRFIYRVNDELRAEAVSCERIGLTAGNGKKNVQVLMRCRDLRDNARVVADQLPNLLDGVLLKVIESD